MYLGMYSFRGDPAELLAAHDRLLAMLPAGQLELHLCVQTPEGIIVLDSCPSREVFDRFSSGLEFRGLVAAAGLPEPEARGLGEVRGYVLPGGVAAP
ncbi:hypothetical protein [Arthrobacter sp. PsM3]|uniref:hypothetical protein n=1 Tax=Arthrobacter sp. PsM3 TaxID=3030531 RepID=UPI00263B764D|nr:hypothetical protein [Arthrobacter sp. PsM3]MDN4643717.1 hypothetical protein [Arthrobacter sp. PsM3]